MGILKKVVSSSVENLLGDELDDIKSQFADTKRQLKEQADATGLTQGLNKAKDAIGTGKAKIHDLTADKSTKNTASNLMNAIPDNVVVVPVNNQQVTDAQPQNSEFDSLNNQMDQIKKLKDLVDMGILSQEEFEVKKKEVLGI